MRFVKPRRILEVGAGYTSLFLLQALHDNALEVAALRARASHVSFKPKESLPQRPSAAAAATTSESNNDPEPPTLHGLATFTPQRVPWNVPGSLESEDNVSSASHSRSSDSRDHATDTMGSNDGGNVQGMVRKCGGSPRLDVIDNMAHGHTTANLVAEGADQLGLRPLLRIHQVTHLICLRMPLQRRSCNCTVSQVYLLRQCDFFVRGGAWLYSFIS